VKVKFPEVSAVTIEVAPPVMDTVALLPDEAGLMIPEMRRPGAVRFKEKVRDIPFTLAVNTAVWPAVTAAAVAVKPALDAAAATLTLVGTVTLALLLARATVRPPLGAALLSVTLQAAVPEALMLVGVQVNPLRTTAALSATLAVRVCPWKEAVRVAEESALTVPAVAVKVPVLKPELMVKLAGTASTLVLLDRPIVAEPIAGVVNVTVQTVACPVPSVLGVQLRLDSCDEAARLNDTVFDTPPALAVTTAV
jgi:hypothetical protein